MEPERRNVRNTLISIGLTAIVGAGIVRFDQEIYDLGEKAMSGVQGVIHEEPHVQLPVYKVDCWYKHTKEGFHCVKSEKSNLVYSE